MLCRQNHYWSRTISCFACCFAANIVQDIVTHWTLLKGYMVSSMVSTAPPKYFYPAPIQSSRLDKTYHVFPRPSLLFQNFRFLKTCLSSCDVNKVYHLYRSLYTSCTRVNPVKRNSLTCIT